MSENKDLVHILKLLDDESPKVRMHVWEKLEANLFAWEGDIRAQIGTISGPSQKKLLTLLTDGSRRGFRKSWLHWREIPNEMEKLEAALSGIALLLSGQRLDSKFPSHPSLRSLLDGLAQDFRNTGRENRPSLLAEYLFSERGLRGSDAEYYDSGNSNLVQVIETGRGIPITLASVFMLVGHRLGLHIFGCDVPEHFLTRAIERGQDLIIDCFDGGKILDRDRLGQLEQKYAPEFSRLLRSTAAPESIIARVLRNLINAYHLSGDKASSEFIWTLADDLRAEREGPEELQDLI